jgi:hypothetical protein
MKFASKDNYSFLNYSNFNIKSEKSTKIYNCSVTNKYLIVGKHLLTTFLVILKSLKGTINNLRQLLVWN